MSKLKVHVRIAKNGTRHAIAATLKPSNRPLFNNSGAALPTIAFAVMLDIDPAAFKAAERVVAELAIGPEDASVVAELEPST